MMGKSDDAEAIAVAEALGDEDLLANDGIGFDLRPVIAIIAPALRVAYEKGHQAGIEQAAKTASDWISTTFPLHEPVDWETHEQIGRDIAAGIADAIRALSSL